MHGSCAGGLECDHGASIRIVPRSLLPVAFAVSIPPLAGVYQRGAVVPIFPPPFLPESRGDKATFGEHWATPGACGPRPIGSSTAIGEVVSLLGASKRARPSPQGNRHPETVSASRNRVAVLFLKHDCVGCTPLWGGHGGELCSPSAMVVQRRTMQRQDKMYWRRRTISLPLSRPRPPMILLLGRPSRGPF